MEQLLSLAAGLLFLSTLVGSMAPCPHLQAGLLAWEDADNWPGGTIPGKNAKVEISKPYLLSGETERLKWLTIKHGGKLVFNPSADNPKLIASQVVIENGGELNIGKNGCRFYGNAEIMLTGKSTDSIRNHTHFGMKFIGVEAGGHFTVAGPRYNTWTRLIKTLTPKKKSFSTVTDGPLPNDGYHFFEFDEQGKLLRKQIEVNSYEDALAAINKLETGTVDDARIIVVVKFLGVEWQLWNRERDNFALALENKLQLAPNELSKLRAQEDKGDPYMMMWHTKKYAFPMEEHSVADSSFPAGSPRVMVVRERKWGKVIMNATFEVPKAGEGFNGPVMVEIFNEDIFDHTMEVENGDIDRWRTGDKFVIASTDYDYNQAEVFTIYSKPASNKIRFFGDLKYEHYGKNSMGVNMFAEVGKLTHKIKIHGEMEDHCYDEENQHCSIHGFTKDNFGGHTMALENFGSYEISGAELYNMGQTTVLGRYPIHFHRARDTKGARIEHNSIHTSHSRCLTIHASDHVQVYNNVCHDHVGHGFFLEDGAEKYSNFTSNLGLGTHPGVLTVGDNTPTTFWITSPLTSMVNNVAAGSGKEGVGMWYLFPDEPVGESTGEGQFLHEEAKYTLILSHKDNVVHSNGRDGLAFFKRLGVKHNVIGCSTYSPRKEPRDENSDFVPINFEGIIAYKNRQHGFVARSSSSEIFNGQFSDNLIGVVLYRNHLNGYSRVRNCTFVGLSDNMGAPSLVSTGMGQVQESRSFPNTKSGFRPFSGITIWHEGPTHIHNCTFNNFTHNSYRNGSAIMYRDHYLYANGITSSAKELVFNFKDPEEGFHLWNPDAEDSVAKSSEHSIGMVDLDGTLTGDVNPPAYTYKGDAYFVEKKADGCVAKSKWNMLVCKKRFARIYMSPYVNGTTKAWMTNQNAKELYNPGYGEVGRMMSFTIDPEKVAVLHWDANMPERFSMSMGGLEKHDRTIVGFCMPKGTVQAMIDAGEVTQGRVIRVEPSVTVNFASRLSELRNEVDKNIYMDAHRDIIYRKYYEVRDRKADDLSDCIDGLNHGAYCPYFGIHLDHVPSVLDSLAAGANCTLNLLDRSVPL